MVPIWPAFREFGLKPALALAPWVYLASFTDFVTNGAMSDIALGVGSSAYERVDLESMMSEYRSRYR